MIKIPHMDLKETSSNQRVEVVQLVSAGWRGVEDKMISAEDLVACHPF
jgi:hypothetical protein